MNDKKLSAEKKSCDKTARRNELNRRFLGNGFEGFTDEEIIELMLYCSGMQDMAWENAKKLLDDMGSVYDILDADPHTLMKMGVSEKCAVFFRMMTAVSGRYFNSAEADTLYDTPEKLIGLFRPHYAGLAREEFRVACFKEDMSLIVTETVSRGSGIGAEVNCRALIEVILRNECSVAAVSHNHPNASCEPSDADKRFTAELYRILDTLGIELADHIIVGRGSALSMREGYPELFTVPADEDEDIFIR